MFVFAPLFLAVAAVAPTPGQCGPENGQGRWVRNGDYPSEARRRGQRGTVYFTLKISPEGCPTACTIVKSSGFPILDQATCDLMLRRAKFEPKRDENGTAIAAEWSNKAVWDYGDE